MDKELLVHGCGFVVDFEGGEEEGKRHEETRNPFEVKCVSWHCGYVRREKAFWLVVLNFNAAAAQC